MSALRYLALLSFSFAAIVLVACRSRPSPHFNAGTFGHDSYVYIGREQQVQVYNVARPDNPQLVATWEAPGPVRRIVTNGSRAYVLHQPSQNTWSDDAGPPDGGVQLVNISRPHQPQIQSYSRARPWVEDALLLGNLVYLADWDGLSVIEWTSANRPREVGHLPQGLVSLEADGDLLLGVWGGCSFRSGDCSGGLWLADVSQPQKPLFLAELLSEQQPAYDVALLKTAARRYALVAGQGLWVVDVTDPDAPQAVARHEVTDGFYQGRIVIKEHYAILATDAYIRVYDMSRPESPLLVGQMDWRSPPLDMMLAGNGNHLYLATWDGLSIIDVSDPQRPFLVAATYDNPLPPPVPTATP